MSQISIASRITVSPKRPAKEGHLPAGNSNITTDVDIDLLFEDQRGVSVRAFKERRKSELNT
jgi:hypothetical protein